MDAAPSVRILSPGEKGKDGDGTEHGYVLNSPECGCPSRWLPHDWRKGHIRFVSAVKP